MYARAGAASKQPTSARGRAIMDENHGPAARRQFLRAIFMADFFSDPNKWTDEGAVLLNFRHKRRAFAENEIPPVTPCQQGKSLPAALDRLHKSLVFHLVERICSCGRERRSRGDYPASHGVFPVKLIRLGRPLACHPQSGAKRSGAGSEATLTRRRPANCQERARPCALLAASVASAALIHFGIASPLPFGLASPLPLDPKREPVFRMQPRRPHHLTSGRACRARTIIPHARGRRARVGGTILLGGVFQPGGAPVTARPDPAKPSRSASLEGGQVAKPSLECWSVGVTEPSVRPP